MSLEQWLAFATASVVLPAIPGPTILLVISYARGGAAAVKASMCGLSAVVAASARLFTALKWIGTGILIIAWRKAGA